jgi:pantoate--beta-alanine ligase
MPIEMRSKKINSLKVITSLKEMQKICLNLRKTDSKKISLIPTMGALHDGHLGLIKKAKKKKSTIIVTIFVNPKQFNDKKDLVKYPKTFVQDLDKLERMDVDYLFAPRTKDIYPDDFQTKVVVKNLKNHLCGLSRDGHFDGVTSVVLKIFNITLPDYAFFGEKDLQQLIIIRQMTKDLNLPIQIISHPIVREKDGLAMSSRNIRLSKKERTIAPFIYKGLVEAKKEFKKNNNRSASQVTKDLRQYLLKNNINKIEYIKIIDSSDISYPKRPSLKNYIVIAVQIGSIRLIDNLKL